MTIASMLDELKRQHAPAVDMSPSAADQAAPKLTPASPAPTAEASADPAPVMSARALFSVAAMRGWEVLPYRPGEQAGGSQKQWRAFVGWVHGVRLAQAARAAWENWPTTVEHYQELMADPRIAALGLGRVDGE